MTILRNLYRLFLSRKIYYNGEFSHESERWKGVFASTEEEAVSKIKIRDDEFTECSNLRVDAGQEKLTKIIKVKENVNRGGKKRKGK